MVFFVRDFATTFLATMLLTSGAAHVFNVSAFRETIDRHGLVPTAARTVAALAVIVAEIAVGLLTIVAARSASDGLAAFVFGGSVLAGVGFVLYLRKLLRSPVPMATCGCSPLASPLTHASLVPAASLALVSGAGLVVVWLGSVAWPGFTGLIGAARPMTFDSGPMATLPVAWGLTFAGIVWLIPATAAPALLEDR